MELFSISIYSNLNLEKGLVHKNNIYNHPIKYIYQTLIIKQVPRNLHNIFNLTAIMHH